MASKKKSAAKKRPAKRAAAKRPAKRAVKRTAKKSARSSKRPAKKTAKRRAKTVDVSKLVIPPVPTRGASSSSSFSTSASSVAKSAAQSSSRTPEKKKSSSGVFFLVIAGVVLLAIFALSNSSDDGGSTAEPTPTESVTEEPTAEPTETATEGTGDLIYEAPSKFVAINNASGGVTLRWKAPMATEGLTGYLVSISYNAVDFKEVATVPADQLNLDIARVGDEGGTQFFIQSVYSDGNKADGAKFALKGKYE